MAEPKQVGLQKEQFLHLSELETVSSTPTLLVPERFDPVSLPLVLPFDVTPCYSPTAFGLCS